MENENNGEQTPEINEQPEVKNKKIKLIIYVVVAVAACFGLWFLANSIFVANSNNKELPEELADLDLPSPKKFEKMSDDEKAEAELEMVKTFSVRSVIINEELKMENPEVVSSGKFTGAESYRGMGQAKILKSGNSYLLRFEKFEVTAGPALHVLLSSSENPTDDKSLGEYVDLGELKGTMGNQNYVIDGIDTSKYKSVVIYSNPFNIVFSVANLK